MKNVGSLAIDKGLIEGLKVKIWDAVPDCEETCEMYLRCPYDKRSRLCDLRKQYINSVFGSLTKAVSTNDEMSVHILGMLIMPLYLQLISIKMEIYMRQGNMRGKRGGVDPIYKEQRECITLIHRLLKEMNINPEKGGGGEGGNGDLVNGNGSYYDELLQHGRVPA